MSTPCIKDRETGKTSTLYPGVHSGTTTLSLTPEELDKNWDYSFEYGFPEIKGFECTYEK